MAPLTVILVLICFCLPEIADQWSNFRASLDKVDQEGSSDDRAAGTSYNFRWSKRQFRNC